MSTYDFMILDSLQKVFPDQKPTELTAEQKHFYAFGKERISIQVAYTMEYDGCEINRQEFELVVETAAKSRAQIRKVELVPSRLPAYYEQLDDNYLYKKACLCPDLLLPVVGGTIRPAPYQWRALWLTFPINEEMGGKTYPVVIQAKKDGTVIWEDQVVIHVLADCLPEQKLIHTNWLHMDCLADYYEVSVFSEEHWKIMDNYINTAVNHGVNMILTPIFTPPLDTEEGKERTTVQLVGVTKQEEEYRFDFSLLSKWINMCRKRGIRYFEIAHLFTQWGAEHAPKIMAFENGQIKRIFGWDTPAVGAEYNRFLHQLIPALKQFLKDQGVFEQTYFHISDEPQEKQKETYLAAKNSVSKLLEGCRVIDALSSYELYREGIVEHPIPCNNHIQPFLDAGVKDLWTYYCCVQGNKVSNRFMAIPSARNRILGVQLYLYDIKGFLHWGFNFYYSQLSRYPINPYLITDADGGFPSGDPFVVYPAKDGTAYESLRLEVFAEALYDLRALEKLEEIKGRKYVTAVIQEGVEKKITFDNYPQDADYIRRLRKRIYEEVKNNNG